MRKSSKAKLREAFLHLENEVPGSVARQIRNLRHPHARWARLPVGVLFVLGGLVAPLVPIFGVWMIPLGLLLLAYDVPFLRRLRGSKALCRCGVCWRHVRLQRGTL